MSQPENQQTTFWTKAGAWLAGIAATVIAGLLLFWFTSGGQQSPSAPPTTKPNIPTPTATVPEPTVWQEGILIIPVSGGNTGRAADLDAGRLLPLGTSIPASDVDVLVRQAVHGVVIEPGLSKGDGVTFDARFTDVNDRSVGQGGCADAAISPEASNHLQLSSDIDVGSYVCMVTTNGRLAEFEITKVNLSDSTREIEIRFVVWASE